jgi:hypothetical protein
MTELSPGDNASSPGRWCPASPSIEPICLVSILAAFLMLPAVKGGAASLIKRQVRGWQ